MHWLRLKSCCSSSIWLDSMREKSSMSLMMLRSMSPLFLMSLRCCLCSFEISPCSRRSVNPMMPLRGVRISWLIVARKSDLAWLALMAALVAISRSRADFFVSVMSLMIACMIISPSTSNLVAEMSTGMFVRSDFLMRHSNLAWPLLLICL